MLTIKRASFKDISLLTEIGRNTFEEAFSKDNTPANMAAYLENNFTKAKIIDEIKDMNTQFFLAYVEDKPAGYAKVRLNNEVKKVLKEKALELERIYVLSVFQGMRVGAALLQTCEGYAREKGFKWLWLGVWEHNHKAQNFYAKWGFEKFGQHLFQMGDDAQTDWVMKKYIDN